MKIVETYTARMYIAGDINDAKRLLRAECYQVGLCVTVEPTTFIYTGGEESGIVVGFVNYPRFPSTPDEVFERAVKVAYKLIPALNQKSALVVGSESTAWVTVAPPGTREDARALGQV
jgi:hypothetical protein